MDFIRSSMISSHPEKIEVGEKANTVTSFLDHSGIYGSDYKTMSLVRGFNGGRMKVNLKNVLPIKNGTYFSGDDRVTQNPFLAIWHSIFLRNHNLLADKLANVNRHWDGERIFQEARKINIAIYQKIVYREWLPVFMGDKICTKFDNVSYNPDTDPSTTNEFSAASFRFLHSFVDSKFLLVSEENEEKLVKTSDVINQSKILDRFYDDVLRGLLRQKINLAGYSSEILNKMFKGKNELGLDLLSMDIMRGRDHGVAAYYKFRKMCNMKSNPEIRVWDDLASYIPAADILKLRQNYKSVYDVDLLVAAALEGIVSNKNSIESDLGFFGPTLRCIVAEQFYRFKAGDSFFYSHPGQFNEGERKILIAWKR